MYVYIYIYTHILYIYIYIITVLYCIISYHIVYRKHPLLMSGSHKNPTARPDALYPSDELLISCHII